MHNTAQYGVAAHWKYKAGLTGKVAGEQRFDWIRQILDQQQEGDDVEQIADAIKVDLAPDEVYVFTPKGDVIVLPLGSTVIDFAYAIHTQVGHKMTGAKVGGRMIRFDYELKTGDIVEVLTTSSQTYGPNRNWLDIAKTSEARGKIRAWFKKECREENIAEGMAALEGEFHRSNIVPTAEFLKEIAAAQKFESVDDFYAAIGYGGVKLSKIMQRIKDMYMNRLATAAPAAISGDEAVNMNISKKQRSGVIVEGIDNCLIKFAKCCNPLPGDKIIGFITRGYGVSVHKQDCVNVLNASPQDKERWINVMWAASGSAEYYNATIDIISENMTALADITSTITASRFLISNISAHPLKNGNGNIIVTVEVASVDQLNTLIQRIQKRRRGYFRRKNGNFLTRQKCGVADLIRQKGKSKWTRKSPTKFILRKASCQSNGITSARI